MILLFCIIQQLQFANFDKKIKDDAYQSQKCNELKEIISKVDGESDVPNLEIDKDFTLDASCIPSNSYFDNISENFYQYVKDFKYLRIKNSQPATTPTLTIKLSNSEYCKFLKIDGNINLVFADEQINFKYFDISEVQTVQASVKAKINSVRFISKWQFLDKFEDVSCVHLKLLGSPISSDSALTLNNLNQYLSFMESNSMYLDIQSNSEVQFSNNTLTISFPDSHSTVNMKIPSYNFTTSFYFNVFQNVKFGISGDLSYSTNFFNFLGINLKGSSIATGNSVSLGPGNYAQLNLNYKQFYGSLAIDNSYNFSSIDLSYISSITLNSSLSTTGKFSIYRPPNSEFTIIATDNVQIACQTFYTRYINRVSASNYNISLITEKLDVSSVTKSFELVNGQLTLIQLCGSLFPELEYDLIVDDFNIPNHLKLKYHSRYHIKAKTISGTGKIFFVYSVDYDKNFENQFTPYIQVENDCDSNQFGIVYNIYYNDGDMSEYCRNDCDAFEPSTEPYYQLGSYFQVFKQDGYWGVNQQASYPDYQQMNGDKSPVELYYYIFQDAGWIENLCNLDDEYKGQCITVADQLPANLFSDSVTDLYIRSYPETTPELDLSFINHEVRLHFEGLFTSSDSDTDRSLVITKLPNHQYIKSIDIQKIQQSGYGSAKFKVVTVPSFTFSGNLIIYPNAQLEAKDTVTIISDKITIPVSSDYLLGNQKYHFANPNTLILYESTILQDLNSLIDILVFDTKECTLQVEYSIQVDSLKFNEQTWDITYQDNHYSFQRGYFPRLIVPISHDCEFTCDSKTGDPNTEFVLEASDYEVQYTFEGCSELAQFPFYLAEKSVSLKVIVKDSNIFPININSQKYDIHRGSVSLYIAVQGENVIFDKYVFAGSESYFYIHPLNSESSVSGITFKKYVDIYSLQTELKLTFEDYYSVQMLSEVTNHEFKKNSEKVININGSVVVPLEKGGKYSDYTINIYVSKELLYSLLVEGKRIPLYVKNENEPEEFDFNDFGQDAPKINLIIESVKDIKAQDFINSFYPEGTPYHCIVQFENLSQTIPLFGSEDIHLLEEKVSFASTVEFNDVTLKLKHVTENGYEHSYELDQLDNLSIYRNYADDVNNMPEHSDQYKTGLLLHRANHDAYAFMKFDSNGCDDDSDDKNEQKSSVKKIVFFVVVGVAALIIVIVTVVVIVKCRKRHSQRTELDESMAEPLI